MQFSDEFVDVFSESEQIEIVLSCLREFIQERLRDPQNLSLADRRRRSFVLRVIEAGEKQLQAFDEVTDVEIPEVQEPQTTGTGEIVTVTAAESTVSGTETVIEATPVSASTSIPLKRPTKRSR